MSVVVIGVNHRTAPLDVLEAVTVADDAVAKTLHALSLTEHVSEAVVLSTCNRTEVYAVAERFHGGYADIRSVLAEQSYLDAADIVDHLFVHHDTAAVAHLFAVASGLDSVVLGEHEIQGQVKKAWEAAQREGAVGPTLNLLFRHALEAGKRARRETGIGEGTASVSFAAVEMATRRVETLAGRRVVVLGAGEMGASMAASVRDAGAAEIVVANRSHAGAVELAAAVGGRAVRLAEVIDELAVADVLLSSTGAATVLLSRAEVETAVAERTTPLVIVDVAVPRDVDPSVGTLPGVTVLDMDDIGEFASLGIAVRAREVDAVRAILDDEMVRYRTATAAREAAPVIVALREAAEAVRTAEVGRAEQRLDGLSDDQRAAIEALSQQLVAKLLHRPTVALRDAAGTAKGERLVQALRDLFELELDVDE